LFFKISNEQAKMDIDEFISACEILKKNKTGALFVIEKNNSLDFVRTTGDELNCVISAPLIESIFFKNSPLHDGAVIIEGNFITGSRIILPVSENENINSRLGLRHRAAIGITEKTDALAIVISEENGKLSLVKNGELKHEKNLDSFKSMLEEELD
jgi:DNA integrity scanning protein DisA with diadenylate cyclase activity